MEAVKANKSKWTDALQATLDETIGEIADIDEEIAALPAYEVPKGEEKLAALKIVRGRRFNPLTGKEESQPYVQKFNYGELKLFVEHMKPLGFTVLEVLNDPFGMVKI